MRQENTSSSELVGIIPDVIRREFGRPRYWREMPAKFAILGTAAGGGAGKKTKTVSRLEKDRQVANRQKSLAEYGVPDTAFKIPAYCSTAKKVWAYWNIAKKISAYCSTALTARQYRQTLGFSGLSSCTRKGPEFDPHHRLFFCFLFRPCIALVLCIVSSTFSAEPQSACADAA